LLINISLDKEEWNDRRGNPHPKKVKKLSTVPHSKTEWNLMLIFKILGDYYTDVMYGDIKILIDNQPTDDLSIDYALK